MNLKIPSLYVSAVRMVTVFWLMIGHYAVMAQTPIELGNIDWGRDLAAAQRRSAATARPVCVLFQEVPGCETCQNFGRGPLSHPLLVEAIEDLFVPVLVYNNRKGTDAKILSWFQEPAWNNPVVRFLDASGKDVIDRRDGVWSTGGMAQRVIAALRSAGRKIPDYLQLVVREEAPSRPETAEFAMHCFWEGEAKLGSLSGVLATKAGWREGREVVQVRYDAAVVDYRSLLRTAQTLQCASTVYAHTDEQLGVARAEAGSDAKPATGEFREADASDRKYYLRNSGLCYLPLTELQATRINAALAEETDVKKLLSPRQRALSVRIKSLTSRMPDSMNDWVTPDSNAELPAYAARLARHLAAREAP